MPSRPAFAQSSTTKPAEVVADVRVHGNQIVSDEDVLKIAGVTIGAPYSDALLAEITKRLKDSGKVRVDRRSQALRLNRRRLPHHRRDHRQRGAGAHRDAVRSRRRAGREEARVPQQF
jgi:hypothetical protein